MNKYLIFMIVALVAVSFVVVNLLITINEIGEIKKLTGYATDTGTANLTITSEASISFNNSVVNWGSGRVNDSASFAYIDTEGNIVDGNWTAVNNGLSIQNDGNVNVTLNISSSNDAAGFLGGTSPSYKWKMTINETGACGPGLNITSYTDASIAGQVACINLGYLDVADLVNLQINLTVPDDAIGTKGSIITATATAI